MHAIHGSRYPVFDDYVLVLFAGGGIMSYLTFGADVQTVVIVNLDTSSRFTQIVSERPIT